jgi:hypothetical protein
LVQKYLSLRDHLADGNIMNSTTIGKLSLP